MKTAKATLSNFRQTPRKMRLVVNSVRGKKVSEALVNLDFVAKKASLPLKNLIMSALANAKSQDIPTENLIVKTIFVDSGKILYRRMPAARGSAHPIRKRTSSIFIELGKVEPKRSGGNKTYKASVTIAKVVAEVKPKKSTIKKTKKNLSSNI